MPQRIFLGVLHLYINKEMRKEMNINFNPSFSSRKNKQSSNFALATGLTAVLAAAPAAVNSQNLQNLQNEKEIISEFQMADKDNSYKLSTIEFLDCIASKYQNPKEQMKQLEIGLKKFAAADKNMDGELNIDEFSALKENKNQFKNNENVHSAPIQDKNKEKISYDPTQDKSKRRKEAMAILRELKPLQASFFIRSNNAYIRDVKIANDALSKISPFNIVEVTGKYQDSETINYALKLVYSEYPDSRMEKIEELYSMMEKRAKDAGCLNRYQKEVLSKKFIPNVYSHKTHAPWVSSEYKNLELLHVGSEIVSQTEIR